MEQTSAESISGALRRPAPTQLPVLDSIARRSIARSAKSEDPPKEGQTMCRPVG